MNRLSRFCSSAPSLCGAVALLLFSATISAADPGEPSSLELKQTFMKAWALFCEDLPSWGTRKVHPALVERWLGNAPDWLLDLVLLRSEEPEPAILAADARLKRRDGGKPSGLERIEEARDHFASPQVKADFDVLLVQKGHGPAIRRIETMLASARADERVRAAEILARSGSQKGVALLRSFLAMASPYDDLAGRALGRVGKGPAMRLLAGCCRKGDGDDRPGCRAGLGEAVLRAEAPELYAGIRILDPAGWDREAEDGIYVTWFMEAAAYDLASRRFDPKGFRSWIQKRIQASSGKESSRDELLTRRLKLLLELLDAPPWIVESAPVKTSEEAVRVLETKDHRSRELSQRAREIEAALFILASAGKRLDQERLVAPLPGWTCISPYGETVLDQDPRTFWEPIAPSDSLVLKVLGRARFNRLFLAASWGSPDACRGVAMRFSLWAGNREIRQIRLEAEDPSFQGVELGSREETYEIRPLLDPERPACIPRVSEVRLSD